MDKKSFIFWLFICFSLHINSQSYYNDYENLINSLDPIDEVGLLGIKKQTDSLLLLCDEKSLFQEKVNIARSYALIFYRYTYRYDLAIEYAKIDVETYQKHSKTLNDTHSIGLYRLGKYHLSNNNLSKAISSFEKVITLNNHKLKTGQAYCGIGMCLSNVGDLYSSVDYYKKGLFLLEQNATYYTNEALNLALVYEQINTSESLESKFQLLKKIETLTQDIELSLYHSLALNNEIANYYDNESTFNFEESKRYYLTNLNNVLDSKEPGYLGQIYTSIGSLYSSVKKDSALYYFKKGLEFAKDKSLIARNHNLTSEHYLQKEQFEKAKVASNNALKASLNLDSDNINIENVNLIEETIDKEVTIWALINKSSVLIQQGIVNKSSSIEFIKEALFHLEKADQLITTINKNEFEEDSQLYWQEEAIKIYSKAALCNHLLEKPELAFNYIEKGKTFLLNQAISRNISKHQLPEALNVKDFEFKSNILNLKYTLDVTTDTVEKKQLQDSLFNQKIIYDTFKDSLKNNFPQYQNFNKQIKTATISKTQDYLDPSTLVIAYSLSKSNINIVSITKNTTNSFLVNATQELETLVQQYKTLISKPLNSNAELNNYQQTAYKLFELLFPKQLSTIIDGKHLIIIPDGDLQHVPFEALITSENSSDFLIQKAMISYAYSMTSLLNNNSVVRNPSTNFVGFSPINFKNEQLTTLEYTSNEIQNIIAITSGTAFNKNEASKSNFLNNSNDAKIIHLATHASASSNPWIAFEDKKLLLHELYTYKNQADLVVLSACNTSLGKIAKGEGVMSMARGFFYSGAKSVVSTLWNVNDKSSSVLMEDFYKNLEKGDTKSKALHKAKLNYISTHSLSETSPYYWSSFILIGDYEKVLFNSNNFILYTILLITLIIVLSLLLYRKKTKKLG